MIREEETEREIRVEVMYRTRSIPCPHCGQRTPKVHSTKAQCKRDRRLRDKPVFLVLHKRRFRCLGCGKVFTELDPVFGARRRTSQRFRAYLGREALHQTVRHVARKEGVVRLRRMVRRCVTEEAKRFLEVPEKPPPARVLGLDEFSIQKGRVYDTAIVDLEHKRVIGVVSGHRQEEVAGFFSALLDPEQVEVVVMDMHEPFRQAVELCLPRAKVVVEEFHVLMHVHQALDQVRTSLQKDRKAELFRARYLLLKGVERLTPERHTQLLELLGRYPQLGRAWALKEAFRDWYRSTTREKAEEGLVIWERSVREQGPEPFQGLLSMLRTWRQSFRGRINYFDHPYTNGFLEGKNNRIKSLPLSEAKGHQAGGLRLS